MFARWKSLKGVRGWHVWKLKLIDARLYFVSIFVGLLTGLVAVPYHYLLQFFFDTRRTFFDAHPRWYWHIPLFLALWGILIFVAWLVGKMPLITGGGIPQTRGVINGRISYKHPFIEMSPNLRAVYLHLQPVCPWGVKDHRCRSVLMWGVLFPNGQGYFRESVNSFLLPGQEPGWQPLLQLRWPHHYWLSSLLSVLMRQKLPSLHCLRVLWQEGWPVGCFLSIPTI